MKHQVDLFSFVFWRKLKTAKRHFEINWPLSSLKYPFCPKYPFSGGLFSNDIMVLVGSPNILNEIKIKIFPIYWVLKVRRQFSSLEIRQNPHSWASTGPNIRRLCHIHTTKPITDNIHYPSVQGCGGSHDLLTNWRYM